MKILLLTLVSTALINNVVLSQFLGLCPFLGVSRKVDTALGMGGAVVFVIMLSSVLTYALDIWVLIPLNLVYLRTIVFILVIAALVQAVEMALRKLSHGLYTSLGVYLPLITTNCAVLGVALNNVQKGLGFGEAMMAALGTSLGFALAITILAGIRERIEYNDVPHSFKGMPVVLLSAGLMAIAFFGFKGLV